VLAKLLGWFVGFAPCPVLVALGNAAVPRPEAWLQQTRWMAAKKCYPGRRTRANGICLFNRMWLGRPRSSLQMPVTASQQQESIEDCCGCTRSRWPRWLFGPWAPALAGLTGDEGSAPGSGVCFRGALPELETAGITCRAWRLSRVGGQVPITRWAGGVGCLRVTWLLQQLKNNYW